MARYVTIVDGKWRLKMDDLAIELEEMKKIDPTQSPNFNPEKHSSEIRHEWKSVGKYYSSLERALQGLVELNIRRGEDTDLAGLLADMRQWQKTIEEAMK